MPFLRIPAWRCQCTASDPTGCTYNDGMEPCASESGCPGIRRHSLHVPVNQAARESGGINHKLHMPVNQGMPVNQACHHGSGNTHTTTTPAHHVARACLLATLVVVIDVGVRHGTCTDTCFGTRPRRPPRTPRTPAYPPVPPSSFSSQKSFSVLFVKKTCVPSFSLPLWRLEIVTHAPRA